MVVVTPFTFDLREDRTEVHGESNENVLIFETDDSAFDRHRLKLVEYARHAIDLVQRERLWNFKPVVIISGNEPELIATEQRDFVSCRKKLVALGAQRLRGESKGGGDGRC